eukprot:TRINITY_DN10791_c1_g3_i2.p1 TRINITY_DN10791_c1_g3~~TRINITY_DN10791_c1_g3_i2.p1  ORF type:complete len:723 (+),score=144.66 TRINITY_DN10791_c1_g3_i2:52-2169(+)
MPEGYIEFEDEKGRGFQNCETKETWYIAERPADSKPYYYHGETRMTVWSLPESRPAAPPVAAAATPAAPPAEVVGNPWETLQAPSSERGDHEDGAGGDGGWGRYSAGAGHAGGGGGGHRWPSMSDNTTGRWDESNQNQRSTAVEFLMHSTEGHYVDCAFGRGGISEEMLSRLGPNGKVTAFVDSKDKGGLDKAQELARQDQRFRFKQRPHLLSDIPREFEMGEELAGFVADLHVLSMEEDGRSTMYTDEVLDLRRNKMDGQSTSDWLMSVSEEELTNVLMDYAEEPELTARRIAAQVVELRKTDNRGGWTRKSFSAAISGVKRHYMNSSSPSRYSFTGLRIMVNETRRELMDFMTFAAERLVVGGRIVMISSKKPDTNIIEQFLLESEEPGGQLRALPLEKLMPLYPMLKTNRDWKFGHKMGRTYPWEMQRFGYGKTSTCHMLLKEERTYWLPGSNQSGVGVAAGSTNADSGTPVNSNVGGASGPSFSGRDDAIADDASDVTDITDCDFAPASPAGEVVTEEAPREASPAGEVVTEEAPREASPAGEVVTEEAPREASPAGEVVTEEAPREARAVADNAVGETLFEAEAIDDYSNDAGGYLNLRVGDVVQVTFVGSEEEAGWWFGNSADGEGWFAAEAVSPLRSTFGGRRGGAGRGGGDGGGEAGASGTVQEGAPPAETQAPVRGVGRGLQVAAWTGRMRPNGIA